MNPMTWNAPLLVVIAALFGIVFLRATGTYFLGRAMVAGASRTRFASLMRSRAYLVGSSWINRWGAPAVTLCFITVGIQTAVLLSAGVSRMPYRRFFLALIPGCILWAVIYGTLGVVSVVALLKLWQVSPALTIVAGILAVAAVVFGLRTVGSKQRNTVVDEPLPLP